MQNNKNNKLDIMWYNYIKWNKSFIVYVADSVKYINNELTKNKSKHNNIIIAKFAVKIYATVYNNKPSCLCY